MRSSRACRPRAIGSRNVEQRERRRRPRGLVGVSSAATPARASLFHRRAAVPRLASEWACKTAASARGPENACTTNGLRADPRAVRQVGAAPPAGRPPCRSYDRLPVLRLVSPVRFTSTVEVPWPPALAAFPEPVGPAPMAPAPLVSPAPPAMSADVWLWTLRLF